MSEVDDANSHDRGDCLPDCEHPDHEYDGDDRIDIEMLLEMRVRVLQRNSYYGLTEEDLDFPDHEGPVEL